MLEIVVVLLIISTALVAITPLFRQGARSENHYEDMTAAITIAQAKMESLRATPFANLQSSSATAVTGQPRYTLQVIVTSRDSLLKEIETIVAWTDKSGLALTYRLATLKANY